MKELDDLKTSVTGFLNDIAKALTDASIKIDKLIASQTDPALAADLVALKASVDTADSAVKDFDTKFSS